LIADGRARPHHYLPVSGWVTVPMDDVAALTQLFRMSYEGAAGTGASAR
jgi:Luciferase